MIKDALTGLSGGELIATIPLVLFVLVFIAVIVWTFKLDKRSVNRWSEIPLDNDAANRGERETEK